MNSAHVSGALVSMRPFSTQTGKNMAKFTVNAEHTYFPKDGSGEKVATTQVDCIAWGQLAQRVEHYLVGDWVEVEGRLSLHPVNDKSGKGKTWKTEVVADKVTRKSESQLPAQQPAESQPPMESAEVDDGFGQGRVDE